MRVAVMAVAAVVMALSLPLTTRAEVLDSNASGFSLRNEIVVDVDPQRAWRALVEDVDRWWPKDHTWFGRASTLRIETQAGGCFCEIDGARQVEHMRIVFVDPGRQLRMLGGLGPLQGMGLHGSLDWHFAAVDGGTRITLDYVVGGYTPEDLPAFASVVDQVQQQQLGALGQWLTDG